MSLFTLNLNEDEELLTIIRRHPVTFFGSIVQFLVLLSVILAFYKFIPGSDWKIPIVIVALVFSFGFLIYNFIVWFLVSIVITDEKIIDINQKNLNKGVVTEVLIADINKVFAFREGLLQNLLNYGTLVIEIKGGGKIAGLNVRKPEFLMSNLNKLKRDYETLAKKQRTTKKQ